MSIFKKKLYIKLKPLISSLLWNLHHENISFRSKVIPINILENTRPGFKPSPSKIDKQHFIGHTCTCITAIKQYYRLTVLQIWSVFFKFNFYFLGGGHFKYLYLCGGTPKIIKILVVVPQIIDGVPHPGNFSWKSPKRINNDLQNIYIKLKIE